MLAPYMKYLITSNDLLRYLYNEVSVLEKMAIEHELARNQALKAELESYRDTDKQICEALQEELQPTACNLDAILSYSRNNRFQAEFSR